MNIGESIKALRTDNGYTQKQFAEKLSVSTVSVQNWESGNKFPSSKMIVMISELLNVSADVILGISGYDDIIYTLNNKERKLIYSYRSLDEIGRMAVDSICEIESRRNTVVKSIKRIPLYYTPAAAGYAAPIDGADFEMIEVDDTVPKNADYAVIIQGTSMLPHISDGQTIYVESTTDLSNGDIGIFCVDGSMYCKHIFIDDNNNLHLISSNHEMRRSNVFISSDSDSAFKVCGKVIGITAEIPEYFYNEKAVV